MGLPEDQAREALYFTLGDGRTTAITKKLERRDGDVYDFATHPNPTTTLSQYLIPHSILNFVSEKRSFFLIIYVRAIPEMER